MHPWRAMRSFVRDHFFPWMTNLRVKVSISWTISLPLSFSLDLPAHPYVAVSLFSYLSLLSILFMPKICLVLSVSFLFSYLHLCPLTTPLSICKGTLSHPKGASTSGPIIIFVHGTMSSKDHNFVPDLCKKMVQDYGKIFFFWWSVDLVYIQNKNKRI